MTKTYAAIQKQIESLSREAEKLKQKEVAGVISRIKEAIATYGITASDLGLTASKPKARAAAKTPGKKTAAKKKGKSKKARVVRFRDDAGNTWIGRGPRPKWLTDALAAGKKVEDFAVRP